MDDNILDTNEEFDWKTVSHTIDKMIQLTNVPKELMGGKSVTEILSKQLSFLIQTYGDLVESERKKSAVTENETLILADEAQEWGRNYILEHFDRYELQEIGSYIYQKVSDEVYQYVRDTIINEYDFSEDGWEMMYDALADIVYAKIDFDSIWDVLDDILNAPVTFEEKLAEVGMSVRDFL